MSELVNRMVRMREAIDKLNELTATSRVVLRVPESVVRVDPAIELDVNPLKALLRRQMKHEAAAFLGNIERASSIFRHEVSALLGLCEEIARGGSDPGLLFETSDLLLAKCERWEKPASIMGLKERKILLEICFAIGKYHEPFAQAIPAVDVDLAYKLFISTAA